MIEDSFSHLFCFFFVTLIEPKSVNEICFAAFVGSFFLRIIVKASLIANVAITTKTKLIPSDKFIVLKVNLGISDKVILSN